MAEFDWALAHLEGKPGDKKKKRDNDLGLEGGLKLRVDDVRRMARIPRISDIDISYSQTDMSGLSALLFSDGA